jgi:hypothetical protein
LWGVIPPSWVFQFEAAEMIARGVFTSVADVGRKLRKYIRAYAKSARPVQWTYADVTRRIGPGLGTK